MIDGDLIPQSMIQTAQRGLLNANAKQLLISNNTGDGVVGMILFNNGAEFNYTAQEFEISLTNEFGSTIGKQLYQIYNPSGYSNVQSAIQALRTDLDIVCPTANILAAQEAASPSTTIYRDVFNGHILGGLEISISALVDLLTGLPLNSSSSSSSTGSFIDLIHPHPSHSRVRRALCLSEYRYALLDVGTVQGGRIRCSGSENNARLLDFICHGWGTSVTQPAGLAALPERNSKTAGSLSPR